MWGATLMTALKVLCGIRAFEDSARYYAVISRKKLFPPGNQADLSCTSLFHDALSLDVVVPGIFRVSVNVIITIRSLIPLR